jgi:lysine biosynthesis protein LysW
MSIYCQSCEKVVQINPSLEIGKVVECPSCGAKYEVVWLYPLELVPCQDPLAPTQDDLLIKKHGSDE